MYYRNKNGTLASLRTCGSLYWSYRFSKDSNYVHFREWLAEKGIKSVYMADIRANAIEQLRGQLEKIEGMLAWTQSDSFKAQLQESANHFKGKIERIERRGE